MLHGKDACPRFRVPEKPILLPHGVYTPIEIEVENMPQPKPGNSGFRCIVNVDDDARFKIPAKQVDDKRIVCEKTLVSILRTARRFRRRPRTRKFDSVFFSIRIGRTRAKWRLR